MTNIQINNNQEDQPSKKAGLVPVIFYAITCFIAFFGLISWFSGHWQIATFGQGYVPMAPSTAILLILLSSSAIFCAISPQNRAVKVYSFFSLLLTSVVSLTVLGISISDSWQVVERFITGSPETVNDMPIGRMSPLTAIVFTLSAVSIMQPLLILRQKESFFSTSNTSALLSLAICFLILIGYFVDAPLLYGSKTVPMAFLTALSFFFLNLGTFLSSGYGVRIILRFHKRDKIPAFYGDLKSSKIPIIAFLIISIIIGSTGFLFMKTQIKDAKSKIYQELSIISDLKSRQISDWYYERKDDADIIKDSLALQTQISRFLNTQEADQKPDQEYGQKYDQDKQDLLKWMETIEKSSDYSQVILYDAKGVARLWTLKPDMEILGSDDIKAFWEALHEKKIIVNSLHRHNLTNQNGHPPIYMSILIPAGIFSDTDKSAQGVLMLHIDPYRHLYPLIQTWPTDSRTAETLLVKREGNEVVFLNELRHMKNTALKLRLPMRPDLPAAMAINGQKGVVEGIDYRNMHVLSALSDIPGTGWHIVSKIDVNDIYGAIIVKTWTEIVIVMVLILLTGMFFFLFENQRKTKFYRDTLEKQQENQKIKDALLESEKHFRNIFDQAAVGICYSDLDGRFLKVNQRFYEITGYSESELLNLNFKEITHPDDLDDDISKVNELLDGTSQTYSIEKRYLRKDETIVWVNLTVSIDRFPDCSPKSFIGIIEDITESKLARIKLKESEERYATTLAAVNDGLWDWHVPSGNAFFSDHYYTMLGYDAQQFSASYASWRLLVHPEDIGKVEQKLKESLVIGKGFWIDLRMKTKNGDWKWVSTRGKVVERNEDGSVKKMMGTLSDISERKQIENMVIEERERLLVTLRSIGDGVITTDTDAKITLMNKIAEDLTGWKMNEAIGRPIDEVLCISNEFSKKICENPALRVLATGEIIDFESNTTLTSRNGKRLSVEDSAAPILDSRSRIIGTVIAFRDITEKNKTEEALQNAQKLESLSILAGGIAHDFNNLLGGIFGYLDMALEFASERDFKGTTATISSALSVFERAKDLTQQLLTFSKGGAPLRRTESIPAMVREAVSFALTGSNVAMLFEIPDNIWLSFIDKNQMGQVIDNIVINARQAMPSGGTLKASISNIPHDKAPSLLKPKSYVKISLADNGPGIPKESLSHIFDPFFTTKPHGNGLGLATCYSIVKRHEGLIEVESEEGKGTAFHIYLPASTEDTVIVKTESSQKFKGQGKILVMDDEAPMLKVTSSMLGRFGYETLTAVDGDEAIKIIKESALESQSIFAAILDLTVPGGRGGKDIVQEINLIDPTIKVIASSGYSGDMVMANPEKFGFVACLSKPFRIADLARLLEGLSNEESIVDFEEKGAD